MRLWRTEYKSDSEKTTTKSAEQLDLCLRWQQTNHQHPYLNMCPRQDSLLTQQQSSERMWISHTVVVRISPPPVKAVLPLPARRLLKHLHTHSQLSIPRFLHHFGEKLELQPRGCVLPPNSGPTVDHTHSAGNCPHSYLYTYISYPDVVTIRI